MEGLKPDAFFENLLEVMGKLQQLGAQLTDMVNLLRNHKMLDYPGAPKKQVLEPEVAQELANFRTITLSSSSLGPVISAFSIQSDGETRTS